MANAFATLNVPASNGNGTALEVLEMGALRTIVVAGTFQAAVHIEASEDNSTWGPVESFTGPGFKQVNVASRYMRVRIAGYVTGTPAVAIGADNAATAVAVLNVPAANGTGTASNVSALGQNKSCVVSTSADWVGAITLEGSNDGTNYVPVLFFTNTDRENVEGVFRLMRVRISGFQSGTAIVSVGGSTDPGEGGAIASFDPTALNTAVTINVYVDGANGLDSNDGLSTTTALLTVGAVYQKFPILAFNGAQIIVNLAGTGGFGTSATAQLSYAADRTYLSVFGSATAPSICYRGPQMVRVTPTTGPATAALDATPAVAVGNRTRFDFTAAAPGWTANDFGGHFLRITRAGVKVIYELPITENGTNTIFVDSLAIVGQVLNTDTAEIVQPGASLTSASVLMIAGMFGTYSSFLFSNAGAAFERLTLVGAFGYQVVTSFDRCQFSGGGRFNGSTALVNCAGREPTGTGYLSFTGSATTYLASRPDTGGGVDPVSVTASVGLSLSGTTLGIGNYADAATGVMLFTKPLSAYRRTGGGTNLFGVLVDCPGSMLIMNTSVPLQGAGNTDGGLKCRRGAKARINGGAASTLTGTGGSLALETGAVIAYGTGAGQFEEVAGFNGNFHRMGGSTATVPLGDTSQIYTFTLS